MLKIDQSLIFPVNYSDLYLYLLPCAPMQTACVANAHVDGVSWAASVGGVARQQFYSIFGVS